MATRITDIVEKQAYDQVEKLQTDLNKLLDTFNKVANGATLLNKAIMDGTNYTAKAQNTTKTTQALSEMEKMQKKIIETQNKLNAAQTLHGQILAEERVKLLEANQANKDFIKAKQAQAGSIEELRLKLKAAQQEYDRMAASERQAARGTEILNHIKKVDAELKSLEGATGRFQRNVGNYASAFNPLSNSIQQLTREMPAFTNSVQTGFMAISNNLPALFDAIQNIRQQNTLAKDEAIAAATAQGLLAKEQALVGGASEEAADKIKEQATAMALSSAEGVKGKGILKQLATSFFSLSTAISIGITLLTVYGKDIIDWFIGTEKMSEAQKKLNDELKESNKQVADSIGKAKLQMAIITDVTNTYMDREKAYKALNSMYPELLSNMSQEEALNGGIAKSYDGIIIAIEKAMKKKAQYSQLEAVYAEKARIENEIARLTSPKQGAFVYYDDEYMNQLNRDLLATNDRLKAINDTIQKQNELDADAFGRGLFKPSKNGTSKTETTRTETKTNSIGKPSKEVMKQDADEYIDNLNEIDREIQLMNEKTDREAIERVRKRTEEIKQFNIKAAKEELDLIKENLDANQKMWDAYDEERLQSQLKRLDIFRQAVQLAEQILNNIGGLIADQANARAERELKELDRTTSAQLAALDKVAMSVAQKEEEKKRIEIQSEARRKQIERDKITDLRKAAKLQKAADIASIISGTAVAIINALKTQPTYLGIALAAGIGANGAIQLARAYAAPLPQYAKGRNGGKEEFAEVNENGVELIESKDGKLSIANGGKRGVTFLKQGDKVHTNEDFMKMVESRTTLVPQYTSTSSDMFQQKQLQAVYDLQKEVKGLNSTMMRKKDGWLIEGTFAHDIRVESIRM